MIRNLAVACLLAVLAVAGCSSLQPCGGMPCQSQEEGSY